MRTEKRRLHAEKKERNAARSALKLGLLDMQGVTMDGVTPLKMEGEVSYLRSDLIFADKSGDKEGDKQAPSGKSIMKAPKVPDP